MVANIIYSNRLIATWVKCHLVAINPSGIYHDYRQKKNKVLYWCYYPHQSRDSVSPVYGIKKKSTSLVMSNRGEPLSTTVKVVTVLML